MPWCVIIDIIIYNYIYIHICLYICIYIYIYIYIYIGVSTSTIYPASSLFTLLVAVVVGLLTALRAARLLLFSPHSVALRGTTIVVAASRYE